MINSKKHIGLTVLFLFCIAGVALLIGKVAPDHASTLEQMLSVKDRALVNHYRQLFGAESEPVIVALQDSSFIGAGRIEAIENTLRSIRNVSFTLSSVSVKQFGFDNAQLFRPQADTELILVIPGPGVQQLHHAKEFADSISRSIHNMLAAGESVFITGQPQIRAASWEITERDLAQMLPVLVVIIVIITVLFFRSYAALALSLLLTSLTTLLCLALHLLFRAELHILLVLAVPVIWSVATLDAFHIYNRAAIRARQNHPDPVKAAGREVYIPCLLTTLTTAACFLTLTILDTSPLIITFGLWCAAGAVIAFILTFTLGEKLLTFIPFDSTCARWPGIISLRIVNHAQRYYYPTVVSWCVLLSGALLYIPQLQVSTAYPQVFTADEPVARDIIRVGELTHSDLNVIDIIIEPADTHGKDMTAMASALMLVRNYLHTIEETRLVLPFAMFSRENMKAIFLQWQDRNSGNKNEYNKHDHLKYWFNEEERVMRLQLYLVKTSFERKQEIINWLRHFDETMLSHHRITLAGSGYFYCMTEQRGLHSLLLSCGLSLVLLAGVMYWIAGNGLRVLIALAGSVVPAILLAGGMAVLNIPWSIAMLPLPAVLLGLMNDDTIHMIWSARASRRFSARQFRYNAINAGPALLATTLVLASAVAILMLSGIQTNRYLGMLVPAGLLLAYLCNLSLVTALCSWLHKLSRSKD